MMDGGDTPPVERRHSDRETVASQVVGLQRRMDAVLRRVSDAEYNVVTAVDQYQRDHESDWGRLHATTAILERAELGLKLFSYIGAAVHFMFVAPASFVSGLFARWRRKSKRKVYRRRLDK